MSSGFDWQTDDEEWEDPGPRRQPAGRRARRLPLLLIMLALLAAGGLTAYRNLSARAAAGENQAEADLLAAFGTLQRAAAMADPELALTVLSGRDTLWSAAQQEVIGAGLLYDRSAWGLRPVDDMKIEAVSIHPTLLRGVITTTQTFAVVANNDQEISLRRRDIFRRGENAWLYAAQLDDGVTWTQNTGSLFTLSYRDRDAALGAVLAARLESTLRRLCGADAADCTAIAGVQIELTDDPRSLLNASQPVPELELHDDGGSPLLRLPSPALLGEPLDSRGASVLRELYERLTVSALVAAQVDYRCCDHFPLHASLSTARLAAAGFGPTEKFDSDGTATLGQLAPLWNATTLQPGQESLALLLHFLTTQNEKNWNLVELHQHLARTEAATLSDWVGELLPTVPADLQERLWANWLADWRTFEKNGPIPPQEALLALCPAPAGTGVFRLDAASAVSETAWPWQLTHLIDRADIVADVLSDGQTLLFQEAGPANLPRSIILLEDGKELRLDANAFGRTPPVFFGHSDPGGRYLPGFVAGPQRNSFGYVQIDRRSCSSSRCELQELIGVPYWSPAGTRSVLLVADRAVNVGELLFEYGLFVGDASGQSPTWIGYGQSPQWLDENTLVYVDRDLDESSNAVRIYHVETAREAEVLVSMELIRDALPAEANAAEPLVLDNIFVNPHDRAQIFIVVRAQRERTQAHLVLYREGNLSYVAHVPDVPDATRARFSSDGRRLALSLNSVDAPGGNTLLLYDVFRDRHEFLFGGLVLSSRGYPGVDWSSDGRWLVVATSFGPALISPTFDQRLNAPPNAAACPGVYWLESTS